MAKKTSNKEETQTEETAIVASLPKALTGRGFSGVREIIETNLGENASLGFSDLTKISMPSGGGTVWQIPTAEGKEINQEVIEGVVVAFQDAKSFWAKSLDETGGGTPPDCRSTDLIQGVGTPGILCAECPNNAFGSAPKGEGKACKDLRILYILADNSILPKVIVVPPTSLKAVRKVFLALAVEKETPYYGALLQFRLAKDKNNQGISYSKIEVTVKDILGDDAFNKAVSYNEMLKPMLNGMFAQVIEGGATHEEENDDDYDTEPETEEISDEGEAYD